MNYAPHARVVMSGTIGGDFAEIFSMSFSVGEDTTASISPGFNMSAARVDDLVADISGWFSGVDTRIAAVARLRQVKVSNINALGKVVGEVQKRDVNVAGASLAGSCGPWQVAQKVTLNTDGDFKKVRGGFYVPCPDLTELDRGVNLWSATSIANSQLRLDQFVEAVNNQPNLDEAGFEMVVASQGRRNPDGTLRIQPANYRVQSVSIGRRPDVVRRRGNAVGEARSAPLPIS